MLMAWGLLGIIVVLAELLLLFLCLLFANHLRSGAGHTRLRSSARATMMPRRPQAISIGITCSSRALPTTE